MFKKAIQIPWQKSLFYNDFRINPKEEKGPQKSVIISGDVSITSLLPEESLPPRTSPKEKGRGARLLDARGPPEHRHRTVCVGERVLSRLTGRRVGTTQFPDLRGALVPFSSAPARPESEGKKVLRMCVEMGTVILFLKEKIQEYPKAFHSNVVDALQIRLLISMTNSISLHFRPRAIKAAFLKTSTNCKKVHRLPLSGQEDKGDAYKQKVFSPLTSRRAKTEALFSAAPKEKEMTRLLFFALSLNNIAHSSDVHVKEVRAPSEATEARRGHFG
uniref:S ribonuclease n=1 Tax=Steinernema glaseri TaxID=37863 RepID=A0A1I7YAH3_9BILA